jgi:hypothetical protein
MPTTHQVISESDDLPAVWGLNQRRRSLVFSHGIAPGHPPSPWRGGVAGPIHGWPLPRLNVAQPGLSGLTRGPNVFSRLGLVLEPGILE